MINFQGWRSLEQRRASHHVLQNRIWSCWDTLANLHSAPGQDDPDYASNAFQIFTNYCTFLLFGRCTVEQPPFPGCPVRWPELIQVNHLQPKPYHAINPEKMFLSALTFYFSLLTLFYFLSLTKIIFTFFYHIFLFLARAAAQNPREGCCRINR